MKVKTKQKLAGITGWYGAFAIIFAYALVSSRVVEPDDYSFQLLNLSGAIGIIIVSAVKKVPQEIVLNAFWAIIALIALYNIAT